MSYNEDGQALEHSQSKVSAIWVVPLIALGIGLWMLYQYINSTGPEITLSMSGAAGIEVGKTEIKMRDVKVGVVTAVELAADYSHIEAKVQMNKGTERMLATDTLFWVVEPRIGKEGISGLDTILSGSYIQIQPGTDNKRKLRFDVLDVPPVAPANAKGLRVILKDPIAGLLDIGDPVIYQGFTAGRVENIVANIEKKEAQYHLFIFEPFDKLVRSTSKFWLNSGVDLSLNAEGFNVRIDSIESLLGGGVSFGSLNENEQSSVPVKQLTEFELFENLQAVKENQYKSSVEFVVLFEDSIRGLSVGAPVEFRGLKIGSVAKVPFKRVSLKDGLDVPKLPVLIKIEPERIFEESEELSSNELMNLIELEFNNGLRAKLNTGSLLTGALFVDVDYDKQPERYSQEQYYGYPVFPNKPGELTEIQEKIMDILTTVNELPLGETVSSVNRAVTELEITLKTTSKLLESVDAIVAQQESQTLPSELVNSLKKLQTTLDAFSSDSSVYRNLDEVLAEFELTLKELQPVLRQINQKPNSLVFGDEEIKDPMPVKGGN
ncbi:intermembrane transport protein PqiB [Pseudoalteromonas luteoviolacea]|uniref:intermembrane transport protein PqiB n=1 Tax=Pseudoalteromonas luteoviolacea TaxID=43657 RepID=UPI001B39B3E7|nr:intermembrane transport protein PqiB [Pseudoalteromonas luteoviolacea]MBQ4810577.1 intermembrane transport protein PqiB [Pseudoalteromonas luteoviolacea]